MDKIYEALKSSIEDFGMARSERKDLKELIRKIRKNQTQKAVIRVKAFELARENLKEHGNYKVSNGLKRWLNLFTQKNHR